MMAAIHDALAAAVPAMNGPTVFIAMAETAIGLGQGVFEAWRRANPGREALFLHTSRYRVGAAPIIEFEEAHSHAPRQFLHLPPGERERALLLGAKACRTLNPGLERVHLATITNFMGADATAALSQRFGLPVTLGAPVSGEYSFQPGQFAPAIAAAQRFDAEADRGASAGFGRYGLERALAVPEALSEKLAADIAPGESVLVLGTGEFMHASYLLGAALERRGVGVVVQSTTRSPILTWGAVAAAISFPDNYGEGVANYLYNVRRGQYDHVFICHETAPNAALFQLAGALDARLFHFLSENHIEEVSEIPVR
jgi:hypothetical protein